MEFTCLKITTHMFYNDFQQFYPTRVMNRPQTYKGVKFHGGWMTCMLAHVCPSQNFTHWCDKVSGCYLVIIFFESNPSVWLMCGLVRSKDKRHEDMCLIFEKNWTMSLNLIIYSTLNNEHNKEDIRISWRNQQTCTFNNPNSIQGAPILKSISANASSLELLVQPKFHCVNLIIRSWRTCKSKTNNTRTPYVDLDDVDVNIWVIFWKDIELLSALASGLDLQVLISPCHYMSLLDTSS